MKYNTNNNANNITIICECCESEFSDQNVRMECVGEGGRVPCYCNYVYNMISTHHEFSVFVITSVSRHDTFLIICHRTRSVIRVCQIPLVPNELHPGHRP